MTEQTTEQTTDKPKKKRKKYSAKRYSISVSGKTYQRLCLTVDGTSIQKFVDGLIKTGLDDPMIRDQILAKCQEDETQP